MTFFRERFTDTIYIWLPDFLANILDLAIYMKHFCFKIILIGPFLCDVVYEDIHTYTCARVRMDVHTISRHHFFLGIWIF